MIRAMCAPISQNCKKGRSRASDGPPFFHEGTRCFCRTQFCRKMRRCRSRWFIAEHSVAAERSSAGKWLIGWGLRGKILLRTKMSRGKGIICAGECRIDRILFVRGLCPKGFHAEFQKISEKNCRKTRSFSFFCVITIDESIQVEGKDLRKGESFSFALCDQVV